MSRNGVRMTADERRGSVLEAALVEFAARGMDGTSTEHVAQRAGISQPYLFRLFPTKKALFIALVERCFQLVSEAFSAAAADRVGEEALDAMGHAYEKLLDDRTLLLLQMHAYAASDDPEIRAATRAGFRRERRGFPAGVAARRADDRAWIRAGHRVLRHGHAHERGRRIGPAGRRRAPAPDCPARGWRTGWRTSWCPTMMPASLFFQHIS